VPPTLAVTSTPDAHHVLTVDLDAQGNPHGMN
jgi:hypothetical protein